jgi:two-component system, NtrC family, sensor histidine kinase HydH
MRCTTIGIPSFRFTSRSPIDHPLPGTLPRQPFFPYLHGMSLHSALSPRFVISATVVVTLVMVATGYIELQQSKEELYGVMREEALSLAETIDRGGTNAYLSMEKMSDLLAARLIDDAWSIARLDSLGHLAPQDLSAIAASNHLYRINVFDGSGKRVMSSNTPDTGHRLLPEKHTPRSFLAPLLSGEVDHLIIGLKEARFEEGQRFAVAVRRLRPGGGAVVVNVDAADFLAFRREVGVGKLVRDLADNPGIVYVALQDSEGILAASREVKELSSLEGDPGVTAAVAGDSIVTRTIDYQGEQVLEVVRHFSPGGTRLGVLRIALSLDELRSTEARMTRRLAVMAAVIALLATLAAVFVATRQRFIVSERKYAAMTASTGNILEQMREGVITVDRNGVVGMINRRAEELLGVPGSIVVGRTPGSALETAGERLKEIFAREDGSAEMDLEGGQETRKVLEVSLSTTRDDAGLVESRTALIRDLTEAKALEREARRKDKLTAMGELASGVAHEIRNPLNAIGLIAQRFSREFTPRSGAREFRALAEIMHSETGRVNAIIRQFLAFARPPDLKRIDLAVTEFTDRVAGVFSPQAQEKGVGFSQSVEKGLRASLDPDQMLQALLNVLQNALHATPPGGTITLTVDPVHLWLRFRVSDTGEGIPPAALEKIFNLYYSSKSDGTGLGLSITQQIVGQHDGRIDVSSSPGKGTVVTIEIPREASAGADSGPK